MTEQHPITLPTELVKEWIQEADGGHDPRWQEYEQDIADRSAEWGYDQRGEVNEAELQQARDEELEACCGWLVLNGYGDAASRLRAARRPPPESLNTIALKMLSTIEKMDVVSLEIIGTIRRALEALPDDL